ncbi:MAG TPA: tetratricopeptide repeat protein, partial [Nannocystaceae bacterium]|nr:tetratricopeptide repeat protein [Nannocystaceae bacterium]
FPVESLEVWRDAVRRAEPVRSFDAEPVPPRIAAAIARGLRADPRGRFPAMNAVIEALDARPRSPFAWLAAAASVAGLAALPWGAAESPAPCERAAEVLSGVWNGERRDAIERSTGSTDAASALDDWAARWSHARRRACEGVDELGDRALQCLDGRRAAFEATVERLAEGAESRLGARGLVAEIPAVEPCADPARLMAAIPLPEEPARAAEAAEIRRLLAGISLRDRLGEHDRATELAGIALARAEALGDPYVLVETKLEVGSAMRSMGQRERAEPIIAETIEAAEQIRHDEVVVQAIAAMMLIVAGDPARLDEVPRLAARGEAALARVGSPPRLVATLETSLYWVDAIAGNPTGAIAHAERGLAALARDTEGGGPVPFSALEEVVASSRHAIGDSQRALDDLAEILARKRELLGEDNLEVAYTLKLSAQIEAESGHRDESIAHAERALAIAIGLFGANDPMLAEYHNTAATSYGAAMRGDEARFHLDRAIAVSRAADTLDRAFLCAAMVNGIQVALMEHDAADAARRSDAAIEMCRLGYGDRHPVYAAALTAGGDAAAMNDRFDEARRRYEEALALVGEGTPERNGPLVGLARIHEHAGEPARAIALLEEAVAVGDRFGQDPMASAAARFELGRLLWDAHRDRPRARGLAAKAREYYATLGEPGRDAVAEIDRWIAEVAREPVPAAD